MTAASASAGTGVRKGDPGRYAAGVVTWLVDQGIGRGGTRVSLRPDAGFAGTETPDGA